VPALKNAAISGATLGNNTLVAAATGKKIRVHSLFIVSAGATTVRFESGAGGDALTGVMTFAAGMSMVLPFSELGWFETDQGELLNMELSAAIQVSGFVQYSEI